MPIDIIPVLEQRLARFERYENFVSEAADAANTEGEAFIVGVKERRVVAVNLLNERGNAMTFMHIALQKPAVQAELDGGYERFLASIAETGHRGKQDLVATALAKERQWGVPLRSRRILDVDNFLERNKPIPAFSEEAYAPVFGWSLSSTNSSNAAVPKSQGLPETESHSATPPTAASSIASDLLDRAGAGRQQPTTSADARCAGAEDRDATAGQQPFDSAVCQGLVPPSVDVTALSTRWRERARWNLPTFADSDAGVLIEDRLARDHFHDAVFSAAKHLDMGLDPRALLSTFYDQLVSLSAGEDHAECRALARMYADYKQLLAVARPAGPQSI